MVLKIISAIEAKPGTNIMVDGAPCTVRSQDISKTGKHGASKCRMECVGMIDGKKRIVMKPGSDRFDVPLVEKKKGQILSSSDKTASIMDLETFETLNVEIAEDAMEGIKEGAQVEYWDIEGQKIIKKVLTQ